MRLRTHFLCNAAAKVIVSVAVLLVSTMACRPLIWMLALIWNLSCLGWSVAVFFTPWTHGYAQRPACRSVALLLM